MFTPTADAVLPAVAVNEQERGREHEHARAVRRPVEPVLVPIPAPEVLVDDETRRRVEDLAHRLQHQNATLEQYLEATGQEPQAFIDEVRRALPLLTQESG